MTSSIFLSLHNLATYRNSCRGFWQLFDFFNRLNAEVIRWFNWSANDNSMTSSWSFSHSASDSWSPCSIQAFKVLPLHIEYISYKIMAPSRIFRRPKLINFSPQTLAGSWIYSKWVIAQRACSRLQSCPILNYQAQRCLCVLGRGVDHNRGYGGPWFDFDSDPGGPGVPGGGGLGPG